MAQHQPEFLDQRARRSKTLSAPFRWAGLLLGFALGGFFDGILLHQVLQWHHLFSAVQAAPLQDMRMQLLADGLFHVLMYAVALVGLYLLWKARHEYGQPRADRVLWANVLLGFGGWHILDSVVSHWLLGIHRIKMDSPDPMFWDLLWFGLFGVLFVVLGLVVRRRGGNGSPGARSSATALTLAALAAGLTAAWPPAPSDTLLVLFQPGTPATRAFAAFDVIDARVMWVDGSGELWAVKVPAVGRGRELYRHGAWLVSNSTVALGCFSWTRPT